MDWQDKAERGIEQRRANEEAQAAGDPLPYPNIWDLLDPTKVPADADSEALAESYRAFRKICRPKPKITYRL